MAVAAAFWDNQVHVTVLDENETSLQAAEKQAAEAGLSEHMSFVLHRIEGNNLSSLMVQLPDVDVVFGLHCCGGLAEAAVELAIQLNASAFCISTCCFRSNHMLASLSQLAAETSSYSAQEHQRDLRLVSRLATRVGGKGQPGRVQE